MRESVVRLLAGVAAAIVLLSALPTQASASPTDDPAVNGRAKEWLKRAQSGAYDRAQLTQDGNAVWTGDRIAQVKSVFATLGDPTEFKLRAHYSLNGAAIYVYRAVFDSVAINEQLSIAGDGKIADLSFRRAPPLADGPLKGEDPSITLRAKSEYAAWLSGKIDRSRYTPDAAVALNDGLVGEVAAQLAAYGAPGSLVYRGKTQPADGTTVYAYRVPCANTDVWMSFVIDRTDKIDGIAFQPE